MSRKRFVLLTAACLGVLPGLGAWAQPASDSNIKFDSPLTRKQRATNLPDVKPQPLAWPRLDAGAVLCRTEDDLDRLARRRAGEPVDGPADCQLVRGPMAITIVQRKGPGRTEVHTSNAPAGTDSWTDAWLPDKAPVTTTSAVMRPAFGGR